MPEAVLQKVYLLLDDTKQGRVEEVSKILSSLLTHVNLSWDLYLITADLPSHMACVESVQNIIGASLRENLFLRCYVHLVHPAPAVSLEEIQGCYRRLKAMTREFDEEGYRHQELPRLMLLPVLIPGAADNRAVLKAFLSNLKELFVMPSLYLNESTRLFTEDDSLVARTEKVYQGRGNSTEMAQVLVGLWEQALFEEACDQLVSEIPFAAAPCCRGLIVAGKDDAVYPCMDAFLKREDLTTLSQAVRSADIISVYDERMRGRQGCLACRESTFHALLHLPLAEETQHELGALLYHLGMFRQETGDHVRAIRNYEQSLRVSPAGQFPSIYFRLGISFSGVGDFDRAIEVLGRAKSAYGRHDYYHFHLGVCHFEKGDYRSALEAFSKAALLKPRPDDLVRILIYLGACHNDLGDYEEARISLERAKALAPHVKEVYNGLGFSYFKLKDYDRAIENLSRAVEIDPHSAIDYASLGANYREKGEFDQAIELYEKALSLDPAIMSARENLEKLKDMKMRSEELASLQQALGHQFNNINLLQEALQHSSYVNEQRDPDMHHNERLEFLGDAVLDVVISHMLMEAFPETREGDLSRMRATIVNELQLAQVAQHLGLGQYLRLGRGESMSNGQEKSSILADALEAVFAAVYLDGGLSAVFKVVRRQFSGAVEGMNEGVATEDFKSRLQELAQLRFKTIPDYRVVAERGPDHDKIFEVRLKISTVLTTHGTGKSKKAAEQAAAGVALQELLPENESASPRHQGNGS